MRNSNFLISGNNLDYVWKRGLNLILKYGIDIIDERNTKTKEVLNLVSVINNPINTYFSGIRPHITNEYKDALLNPINNGFCYTYGERLLNWNYTSDNTGVNQIDVIINRLKNNKNTRRADAITWIPNIDMDSNEVPCLMLIDFKLREDKLNLTAVFRSHDYYGAFPYNFLALSSLLFYISNNINSDIGNITIHSISAHIYETDLENVINIINK